nr:hypothetical protein [Rhodospirillales bacterium]
MLSLKRAREISKAYGFSSLITEPTANAKLLKSKDWYNAGISLAQAMLSGFNMCSASTVQCRNACLGGTGRAEFTPAIEKVRISRTKLYATDREVFWSVLEPELHKVDRKAKKLGLPVAFRPNILSDQPWHIRYPEMFSTFAHWQFYGYTKVRSMVSAAIAGSLPKNMHVTYSWSEKCGLDYVEQCLDKGINVAVPFYNLETFKPIIPAKWHGWDVVSGDISDLRFNDPQGVIVGLGVKLPKNLKKAKARIEQSNGFFVGV